MKTTFKALSIVSFALFAISPASAEKDLNPWQDCGIGSMVFPDNGTASAISNVIWDLGTTAVTSASASEDNCASNRAKTAQFINEAYNQLEEDLVKGDGEHLATLASVMSCSKTDVVSLRDSLASDLNKDAFESKSKELKAETLFNNAEAICSAS